MNEPITIETHVRAPIETVWDAFTNPDAIKVWNAASPDWHTTKAENDLQVGGRFVYRMEAKDGSVGFDFSGVYDSVVVNEHIAHTIDDGRKVEVTFSSDDNGVRVVETFVLEEENSHEMQREGWQTILDNFKKYVEDLNKVPE